MRRRRGRPVSGWVVIDKPAGPTSTQVTGRVRRAFDAAKAGHAGTLDPAATGVLAIALGEATKTMPLVADADKTYRFTVRWGAETSTDDAAGRVTAETQRRPETDEIRAALAAFTGDIAQVPPAVSAVHVDGRRAYDLARSGDAVALEPRPLHVARLSLVRVPDAERAMFEVTCGKGGYVRALARDLGRTLGCLGHVEDLRRLRAGPFGVADAAMLGAVEAEPASHLRPLELALASVPRVDCDAAAAERLRHGNPVAVGHAADAATAWAAVDGRAAALGRVVGGVFHPSRVLLR